MDALEQWYGNSELLPMWVADMDFATPDFIINALKERLEHPIFGYTIEPERYRRAIIEWVASHHDWHIQSEWISYIPGIVKVDGGTVPPPQPPLCMFHSRPLGTTET